MFNKKLRCLYAGFAFLALATINCTSGPLELLPQSQLMHFPFAMAIKNHTLLVSASDGKFSHGRLVAVDTNAVNQALMSNAPKEPIAWESIVTANMLTPNDAGPMIMGEEIFFASLDNNKLYAIENAQGRIACNNADQKIDNCSQATNLQLPENDPYALAVLSQGPDRVMLLASYLSSDRLDMVELDKTTKPHTFKIAKSLWAQKLVEEALGGSFRNDQRITTRKMIVSNANDPKEATIFMLLEKKVSKDFLAKQVARNNSFKMALLQKNIGALLLSIKVSDLSQDHLDSTKLTVWNLQDFAISQAQDFYLDEAKGTAIILGRAPEALFKIDLTQKNILNSQLVCEGASSLAVSTAQDQLFVPCFTDNRVLSFSISSLSSIAATGRHGLGPAFVAVDDDHRKIFVSYSKDGQVGIFDFDLKYLGYIFQPATIDRVGL